MKPLFKYPRLWATLGTTLSFALYGVSGAQAQTSKVNFDTHSIMVLSSATTSSKLQTRGLRVARTFKNVGWSQVAVAPGADIAKTIADLKAQGIKAEPNYVQHFFKTPNDPQYGTQYDMVKIGAPAAWDITTGGTDLVGGADVVVAVLDSGITPNHPDLKANLYVNKGEIPNNGRDDDGNGYVDDVNGYDFAQDNGTPDDGNEHGTHVAGTIGAVGNNKAGVTGVNWKVKLLSCRVGSNEGAIFTSSVISALDYIVGLKKSGVNLRVANHSYGGYFFSQSEYDAFKRASDAGIINVCAAGNDGFSNDVQPAYPASFGLPGMISVAASDQNDKAASFTNIGPKTVNIAAPGVDILSTLPPNTTADGSLYGTLSGTSMASPHVAGAMALLLSQAPTLSMQAAVSRLYATADKLPEWRPRVTSGARLNLAKLLAGASYGIGGKITRTDGSPLAAAVVTLGSQKTTTDNNGFYRFSALSAGKYTLSAQLKGYTFKAASGSSLNVTLGGATYAQTVNMVATTTQTNYSVYGTVYDFFGKPKSNVGIYLATSASPAAVTDSKGQYKIDDLIAEKYVFSAKYRDFSATVYKSSGTSKAIQLPTKTAVGAPNAQLDWQLPSLDQTPPVINPTSPVTGKTYSLNESLIVAGRTFDNDRLASIELALYQDETSGTYNWNTGTFGDEPSSKIFTTTEQSYNFSVPLAKLPVGTYYLNVFATDRSGNRSGRGFVFYVAEKNSTDPNPQDSPYPRITFIYPYDNSIVRANQAFTANGTAHADNGIQNLNFYIEQVDQRGNNLGYYSFATKEFVSQMDGTTTYTETFRGGTDAKWTLAMPALPYGRYVLHAYGVSPDGSQPPGDGSLDDTVAFTAGNNPSPMPTPSSGSGS